MLSEIKGMTDRRLKFLFKMGIKDLYSLLTVIPRKYIDMNNIKSLADCAEGELSVVKVRISQEPKVRYIRRNMSIVEMKVSDGVYTMDCYWFNQPYIAKKDINKDYFLIGKVTVLNGRRRFSAPQLEPVEDNLKGIIPVYSLPKGFRQKEFRNLIENAIGYAKKNNCLLDLETEDMDIYTAIKQLHFPDSFEARQKAVQRIKYDEAMYISCAFDLLTPCNSSVPVKYTKDDFTEFIHNLPFEMTKSQKKAAMEIADDMNKTKRMNRLLQGNVGCGKTVVAMFAMYLNCKYGFQAAFMSPTETLAMQNYENAKKFLQGFNIAFLSGSTLKSERKKMLDRLKTGEVQLVVGTHALIQDDIEFKNLNLVVTDEQHRFGVKQRAKLSSFKCHTLIMSATPIPRTLALIAFNRLDISIINELPKGRLPVKTHLIYPNKRMDMYKFIYERCSAGEQAYVVCPLIDKSENMEAKSAKDIYGELTNGVLKNVNIALLHGRMKTQEKERVLNDFRVGKIKVLVSTTVIEVGVDVKNATIMVIENSDRFGLAALHQLRGRVGRGDKQSYCFAVLYNETENERLITFKQNTDGYKIAMMDMAQRGIGELVGTVQHGQGIVKFIDLMNDKDIVEKAGKDLKNIKKEPLYNEIKAQTLRIYDNLLEDIILN